MGLSSSQARLLSLTARMHDIEYRAQRLEAQKLQLANESDKAYANYLRVLDAKKVQCKHLTSDGSITFIDATYQNLIERGYQISFKDFGYGMEHDVYENFVKATNNKTEFTEGNRNYFIALQENRVTSTALATTNNSEAKCIEVYTATQLANLLNASAANPSITPAETKIRLMSNIDMSGVNYTSGKITNKCTFDGNGYTISGLNKTLFESVNNDSTITNLNVEGNIESTYTNNNGCALLVKTITSSKINNVTASGSVYAPEYSTVGGLISQCQNSTIEYCSTNINVTGDTNVGGFVGDVYALKDSEGNFVLDSEGKPKGSKISNCSANGVVYAHTRAGGFACQNIHSSISNSSSNCTITVDSTMYPSEWDETQTPRKLIAGHHPDSGGFCASSTNGSFDHCISKGSITDLSGVSLDSNDNRNKASVISGFLGIGYGSITNSDSYVDVTSKYTTQISGFAASYNNNLLEIENCNSYGTLLAGKTQSTNTGFATSSGTAGIKLTQCYTTDNNYNFTSGTITGQTTNASAPHNNTIIITSPTIETTSDLSETAKAKWGGVFDAAMASGGAAFDLSNQDPYGLSEHKNDNKWLSNLLAEGYMFIQTIDNDGIIHDVSVSIDTGLQEVDDERDLRKAEAQYEADMRQIDKKDRRYDTELAAVDAERNAVKQELDTLKNVAKDNVDRTFKLFS